MVRVWLWCLCRGRAGLYQGGGIHARTLTRELSDAGGWGWRFPADQTLPVLHPAFLLGWSLLTEASLKVRVSFAWEMEWVLLRVAAVESFLLGSSHLIPLAPGSNEVQGWSDAQGGHHDWEVT